MNQIKYKKLCEDLINFENQVLESAENYFEDMAKKLSAQDLRLDIYLNWCTLEVGDDNIYFTRIEMNEHYVTTLSIDIRKKDDPYQDVDTMCIYIPIYISWISRPFKQFEFHKIKLKKLNKAFEHFSSVIQCVLNEGYDNILNKILNDERLF